MNNKGFTLVDLIVSMAISGVVLTIIISFLVINAQSYSNAGDDINLQMESQTVMNQLYDIIIESNWTETVEVNSYVKALIIYNSIDIDVVFLNKQKNQLYLVDQLSTADVSNLSSIPYTEEENLMASNVSEITIFPEEEEKIMNNKGVQLVINFQNNSLAYSVERNIEFRNEVISQ
ncbi:MAG: PilW family protein [Mobilitalea sp.]